jgi:hypothetical protein
MADPGLTDADLEPAAQHVIDVYLADLSTRLVGPAAARAAIVAELQDGLRTATASHQSMGLSREKAATAAVAEFGDQGTVAAGLGPELAAATGRRVGLGLLTTGPLVGTSWLLLATTTWSVDPLPPRVPAPAGQVAQAAGAEGDRADHQQVPVLAEAQQGHGGRGGEHHRQGPEEDAARRWMAAGPLGGGGGQGPGHDAGQPGGDVAGEGRVERAPSSGTGIPKTQ